MFIDITYIKTYMKQYSYISVIQLFSISFFGLRKVVALSQITKWSKSKKFCSNNPNAFILRIIKKKNPFYRSNKSVQ